MYFLISINSIIFENLLIYKYHFKWVEVTDDIPKHIRRKRKISSEVTHVLIVKKLKLENKIICNNLKNKRFTAF